MANTLKVQFAFEKSTPGAHRFYECDDSGERIEQISGAKIGTLYIRKTALNQPPQFLSLTITYK